MKLKNLFLFVFIFLINTKNLIYSDDYGYILAFFQKDWPEIGTDMYSG